MKARNLKKLLSVLLVFVLGIGCVPFAAAADESTALPESELQNLWKLINDKNVTELKIAYFGGSVTNGSSASPLNTNSWRALVGQWFTDTFGTEAYGKTVTNVNAAIGATGSYFGSYRLYQDAEFETKAPDVLFIEYAINDIYDGIKEDEVAVNYESIIRQAYKANPEMTVISVFTMDNNIAYNVINTGEEDSVYFSTQRSVAAHYNLPQLDVGKHLISIMSDEYDAAGLTYTKDDNKDDSSIWSKYITDTCHPNNDGHAIYAGFITDYLEKQLLSDEVAHNGEVVSVDLDNTPAYVSTLETDLTANLKEEGRYISFKDAGFKLTDLHGYSFSKKAEVSTKDKSNGIINTTRTGASFAFKFTGTAVGFFNQGHPDSGILNYTITSTADPTKQYTGSVSLRKSYATGLPWPAELKTGLDNEEWLVECVISYGTSGSRAELRYIYINGDTSTIVPAEAPDTALSAITPIVFDSSYANAAYYGTISEVVEKDGLSARLVTSDGASNSQPQVDRYTYTQADTLVTFPDYDHVAITYFYDSNGGTAAENIFVQFDKVHDGTASSGWLPDEDSDGISISKTRGTEPLIEGKWVTQFFDMSDFATLAGEIYPGSYLQQARHYPFGDLSASELTSGEKHWFNTIGFYGGAPMFYNEAGEKITYNDGTAIAYVSSEGSVTADGKTYDAYLYIDEAINALSPLGGIIRVSGEASFTDGDLDRKKITLEAADSTALITNVSLSIKKGDLELRNITYAGHSDEYWSYTSGHKLIIGEGVTVTTGLRPAATKNASGKPNVVDIYSGTIKNTAAIGGYGETATITGDSVYNIYGGTVSGHIDGFSRNGNTNGRKGLHTLNGDAIFNIYGGDLSSRTLSIATSNGLLNGNFWYVVNGGNLTGAQMVFGPRQDYTQNTSFNLTVTGNIIFQINNKEVVAAGGTLSGITVGKKMNSGIYNNSEVGKFVIINNNELSSTTGASISTSAIADWQLLVNGGKLTPVFDDSDALLGFRAEPDEEGTIPVIDGVILTADENGLYTIDKETGVTRTVTFGIADSIDIVFTDGTNTNTVSGTKNGTLTLPANTFTNSGNYFAGWKTEGDDTLYVPGESYTLGTEGVTFTAQWMAQSEIEKVYIKKTAAASGTGLSKNSPVLTIAEAVALGGTSRDYTIVFLDEYTISTWSERFAAHTGTITLSSEDDGAFGWSTACYAQGPLTFENIRLRMPKSGLYIETAGNKTVFGENVEMLPAVNGGTDIYVPGVHQGKSNTNTAFQNFEMKSGTVSNLYVGSYYNKTAESAKESQGAKVVVSGGKISRVRLGPDGYGEVYGKANWTDVVSLVINGGTIGGVDSGKTTASYAYPVQIVLNNGVALPTITHEAQDSSCARLDENLIVVESTAEGYVDTTDTAGVFKITTEKDVIYINGSAVEKSEDNLYTINEKGTYTVTYGDAAVESKYYVSVGGENIEVAEDYTVTAAADGTVDFEVNASPEKADGMFLGWYYEDGTAVVNGAELAAGTKITAKFIDFVTDYENENCDFGVLGAQIRLSQAADLRFVNKFNASVRDELTVLNPEIKPDDENDTGIGYGFVVISLSMYDGVLTKETENAAVVPAVNTYKEAEGVTQYTVCITDIPEESYGADYSVIPYITYNDAQGIEHTVYGEEYHTNMKAIANAALSDVQLIAELTEEEVAWISLIAGV